MVYEEKDLSCVENTPHEHTLSDVGRDFDFEEHCLALPIGENHLLLLGNSYFVMTFQEYNNHPSPYGYFQWFHKTQSSQQGKGYCMIGEQGYQEIPLKYMRTQIEWFEGMIQVIDSLADESREKHSLQRLLYFLMNAC